MVLDIQLGDRVYFEDIGVSGAIADYVSIEGAPGVLVILDEPYEGVTEAAFLLSAFVEDEECNITLNS